MPDLEVSWIHAELVAGDSIFKPKNKLIFYLIRNRNSRELSYFLNSLKISSKPKIPKGSPIRMQSSRDSYQQIIMCRFH
jgi:hypothetical protein